MKNKKRSTNSLLFIILFISFFLQSFRLYSNDDTEVYVLWEKYFIKTHSLLSSDHPPLFFILSEGMYRIATFLSRIGSKMLFSIGVISIFILLDRIDDFRMVILLALVAMHLSLVFINHDFVYSSMYSVSFLFSIASVSLVYKIGSMLYDEKLGLYSALVYSVLPARIIYSSIPLLDSVASFFILFTFYAFFSIINDYKSRKISRRNYFIFVIFLLLSFFTKYYSVIPTGIMLLYVLFSKLRKSMKSAFLVSFSVVFVIVLSWLFINSGEDSSYALKHYVLFTYPSITFLWNFFIDSLSLPVAALFLSSLIYLLMNRKGVKAVTRNKIFLLLLMIFSPLVLYLCLLYLFGLSHFIINLSNYMLFTLPFISLIVSFGIRYFELNIRKNLILVLYLLVILVGLHVLNNIYTNSYVGMIKFEYDKNYKTIKGNLDMFRLNEEIIDKYNITRAHVYYEFYIADPYDKSNFGSRIVHGRWISENKYAVYTFSNRNVEISLSIVPLFSDTGKIRVSYDNKTVEYDSIRGSQFTISLKLPVSNKSIIKISTDENGCILSDLQNKCFYAYIRSIRAL